MTPFVRSGETLVAELGEFELLLVRSLVQQLTDLLGGDAPAASDPLEELLGANAVELDHTDPLIDRLFPAAYPDDARAADDFRRFTEEEARRAKVADARVVLDALAAAEAADGRVVVTDLDPWLRTINALRLSLAVRLDIVDTQAQEELAELPEEDPRGQLFEIFEWLGWVLESLLAA